MSRRKSIFLVLYTVAPFYFLEMFIWEYLSYLLEMNHDVIKNIQEIWKCCRTSSSIPSGRVWTNWSGKNRWVDTKNFYQISQYVLHLCAALYQGRRQKNFQGRPTEKRPKNSKKIPKNSTKVSFMGADGKNDRKIAKKSKNSTIKPLSTLFVLCMKL